MFRTLPTTDRLTQLRCMMGLPSAPFEGMSLHSQLDYMDKLSGIRTRHGSAAAYHAGATPFPQSEYVGARLARLERHVEANKEPVMFWLGAEGDTP